MSGFFLSLDSVLLCRQDAGGTSAILYPLPPSEYSPLAGGELYFEKSCQSCQKMDFFHHSLRFGAFDTMMRHLIRDNLLRSRWLGITTGRTFSLSNRASSQGQDGICGFVSSPSRRNLSLLRASATRPSVRRRHHVTGLYENAQKV